MIDAMRIRQLNETIKESAKEGLSQKEAGVRMGLRYGISDSFQLRVWIAVGYCMYEKEEKESKLNGRTSMGKENRTKV